MLTLQQIKESVIGKETYERYAAEIIDNRDFSRLIRFFPAEDWKIFGFELKEGKDAPTPIEYTKENVLKYLQSDLEFSFEKALGRRGISSNLMYEVIKMWMWVLEDDLYKFEEYAMYGLPLFKAVAVKYGFKNPIGEDSGSEGKYDNNYDEGDYS